MVSLKYWVRSAEKRYNKMMRDHKNEIKKMRAIDKRIERANRPRDFSGRKIKIGPFGDELVRVGNKWVLRKDAPNSYFPDPKDIIEPYMCDCPKCKRARIPIHFLEYRPKIKKDDD